MPCYDPRSHEQDSHSRAELDRVTDLLCKAGRACYSGEPIPYDVLEWWKEHAKLDERRGEPWVKKQDT